MLHGHGVITHVVTATVNCKVFAFDVADLRRIFDAQPKIAEKFFLDLALELALELKFVTDKMRRDAKAAASNHKEAEAARIAPVVAPAAAGSGGGVAESPVPEGPVPGAVQTVAGDADGRPPTPVGAQLVPLVVAPVPVAARVPPVASSAAAVAPPAHLQQSQAATRLFSMSMQALPTTDESSDKLWRFFQDTFAELKSFEHFHRPASDPVGLPHLQRPLLLLHDARTNIRERGKLRCQCQAGGSAAHDKDVDLRRNRI